MNEEKTIEKGEPKKPEADAGEGSKYETTPVIERAREEREKMEVATAAQKVENDRAEKIRADTLLGSSAGGRVEPAKEDTDEEYTEKFMKGEENPFN